MESLIAIDMLDDLIHNAKRVGFGAACRIDRAELEAAVARLRAGLGSDLADPRLSRTWGLVERFDALVRDARPVRLLGGVRIDPDAAYELLDAMREAIVSDLARERGAPGRDVL